MSNTLSGVSDRSLFGCTTQVEHSALPYLPARLGEKTEIWNSHKHKTDWNKVEHKEVKTSGLVIDTLEISTWLLGNVCGGCPSPSWNILARTWVCVSSQRWLPVCGYTTAHWPGLWAVLFDSRMKGAIWMELSFTPGSACPSSLRACLQRAPLCQGEPWPAPAPYV